MQTDDDNFGVVRPRQAAKVAMIYHFIDCSHRVVHDTCQDGMSALAHISLSACNCNLTNSTAFAACMAVILQVKPPIAKSNWPTLWL